MKVMVGTTGIHNALSNLSLMKLWVDSLSMSAMTSLDPILAVTRIVLGATHPVSACSVISGSVVVSKFSWSDWSSLSLSHESVLLASDPSNIRIRGSWHLCHVVKWLLQLNHKFWARSLHFLPGEAPNGIGRNCWCSSIKTGRRKRRSYWWWWCWSNKPPLSAKLIILYSG